MDLCSYFLGGNLDIFFYEAIFNKIQLAILVAAVGVISVRLFIQSRGTEGQRDRGTEGQRDRGTEGQSVKVSNFILVGLGILALFTYVRSKPFTPPTHYPDSFHYYVGSKYFPEIGYTRLYACVVRAEAESDDFSVKTKAYKRDIRDLKNNNVVPARLYFFDDTFCKARFSTLRWNTFKSDIEFFRTKINNHPPFHIVVPWADVQLDHGYNAPPVWTLVGGFISNLIPLSDSALMGITQIDIILLFGSIACLVWAFGMTTTAFAVIVGTTSATYSWIWIGGSMLRLDWFFMAILSVCAMKREHYVLAGAALGYAAALRVFPAVFALGPFVALLYAIYKRQYELKVAYGKFFVGMMISAAVLVASATAAYGVAANKEFFDNTKKHSDAISANNVGLRKVLTYNFDEKSRTKILETYDDVSAWRTATIEARKKVVPIYVTVVVIASFFFIPAVVSGGAWQAIALGALFIPFMWSELSGYYYLFLMIVGTLFAVNWKVAFPLLGIGIVTKIGLVFGMELGGFHFLFSAAICIGALVIWWQVNSFPLFWRQALSIFTARKA